MAYLLKISKAQGLRNADGYFGTSDPYCRISFVGIKYNTEVVNNSLSPVWDSMFLIVPPPTSDGTVTFTVMDSDSGQIVDGSDDFLGQATVQIPELSAGSDWVTQTFNLSGEKATGSMTVQFRPYIDAEITIKAATALRNADGIFSKSDPYAVVKGLTPPSPAEATTWGQTNVVRDDLHPVWDQTFSLRALQKMPRGGPMAPLIVTVVDRDEGAFRSDDVLGSAQVPWSVLYPPPAAATHRSNEATLKLTGPKAKGTITLSCATIAAPSTAATGTAAAAAAASAVPAVAAIAAPLAAPPPPPGLSNAQGGRLIKASGSVLLGKGQGVLVADAHDRIPDVFTMGLAWDVTKGTDVDLDASCILLDAELEVLDLVYFSNLRSWDGAVVHSGDEREGDEAGDDERVTVDLPRLDRRVAYCGFVVNSYSGQRLSSVDATTCRLYNTATGVEVARYGITGNTGNTGNTAGLGGIDSTALVMCCLFRAGSGNSGDGSNSGRGGGDDWYMHAVGEGANGRTAKDNVDELQAFLRTKRLAEKCQQRATAASAAASAPPGLGHTLHDAKKVGAQTERPPLTVTVPPGGRAGQVVHARTPEGYTMAVTVPHGVRPGQRVQVARPAIYSDSTAAAVAAP